MSNIAIEFNNVGKQYRLGRVGTGTLSHDINRWFQTSILRREDPYLKIGETNDRTTKGDSDYVWALRDISFQVEQGDVVGIIGKNGAGKSTLLKLLSHITSPSTGSIRYKGRIASLLEVGTGFHPELTGRENIYMNGSIMGMTKAEITRMLDEIVDFAGVERYLDTPVKRYSSGMTVRLGFAVAAFLEPEILVVDEVLTVGDAEFQKKAIGKMNDVATNGGRTVLFVSHNMDSVLNLCRNGILLENGSVKRIGDVKTIVAEYIGGINDRVSFQQHSSKSSVYISSLEFDGTDSNKKGIFSFSENLTFKIGFAKSANCVFDNRTVASIYIMSYNQARISCTEMSLSELQNSDNKLYQLSYPSSILLPGRYTIHVDIHIPNVCFCDQQDLCSFTITDDGTELLKYGRHDLGFIMLRPNVTSCVCG